VIVRAVGLLIASALVSGCMAYGRIQNMQRELGSALARGREAEAVKIAAEITELSNRTYSPVDIDHLRARHDIIETFGCWLRTDRALEMADEWLLELRGLDGHAGGSVVEAAALVAKEQTLLCAHRWRDAAAITDRIAEICRPSELDGANYSDPCDVYIGWRIADRYADVGEPDKAVAAYLRWHSRDPGTSVNQVRAPLLTGFGRYYSESGRFAESLPYFERCLDGALERDAQYRRPDAKVWTSDDGNVEVILIDSAHAFDTQTPRCLEDLVVIQRKLGNADEAARLEALWQHLWRTGPDGEAYLRERVRIARFAWHNDRIVAHRLHDLGFYYLGKERVPDAIAAYEQAVELLEHGTSANPLEGRCFHGPNLADDLVDLAGAYSRAARHDDAVRTYARAEMVAAVELHPGHELFLDAVAGRAAAERDLGLLADSEASWRRYVALAERRRGKDHANVAYGLAALADVLTASGRDVDARSLRDRAHAVRSHYALQVAAARKEGVPASLLSPPSPAN
jgi:tetratricopeptide (TPR) repeat protein